jgi:hypothetical protein
MFGANKTEQDCSGLNLSTRILSMFRHFVVRGIKPINERYDITVGEHLAPP